MSTEQNKKIVCRFFDEVCNGGHTHVISEIFADKVIFNGELRSSDEEIKDYLKKINIAFANYHVEIIEQFAKGNTVSTKRIWKGFQKGEYRGRPATNSLMTWIEVSLVRLELGKIVEDWIEQSELNEVMIANTDCEKVVRDLHQNNYNQKVGFFTQHLSRMWTRFNIFIVAETAIFSGKVFFSDKPFSDRFELMIIGLAVSIVWYVIGAQDKYLVNLYRTEIEESFNSYRNWCAPFKHDGVITYAGQASGPDTEKYHKECDTNFIAWHSSQFTTTSMSSIVPLLLALTWIGLMINYNGQFPCWWLLPFLVIIALLINEIEKARKENKK